MKTNPFTLVPGIDPKVRAELIEIERRLQFLNNIKLYIMKRSDLKSNDRYNLTDRIPCEPLTKSERRRGTIIFIAVMVIGIPLILWVADLLFTIN